MDFKVKEKGLEFRTVPKMAVAMLFGTGD